MLSIIIPVYNEEAAIEEVLRKITVVMEKSNIVHEIIVVDDGSSDNSANVLEKSSVTFKMFKHINNKGYGAALKTGIKNASYKYVAIIDADGTYPSEKLPEMLKHLENRGSDMIVGARVGSKAKIPWLRVPAKWLINKIANYLSETKIPDLNSGLRIVKKELVMKYMRILPNGFSFTTTITLALLTNSFVVDFKPIEYHKREGRSKFRPFADTLNYITLVIRTIVYFNPLKVFLPASFILFLASFVLLLYRIVYGRGFSVVCVILFISAIQVLTAGLLADLIDKRLDL